MRPGGGRHRHDVRYDVRMERNRADDDRGQHRDGDGGRDDDTAIVPNTVMGINARTCDGALTDATVRSLFATAGTDLVRFPEGASSDSYN